jgi:hypothetical protein
MPKSEIRYGKYIYCIIRTLLPSGTCITPETLQFSNLGIGERGDKVHTIDFKGIAAVVSDTPIQEYEESRRNMMAHTRVLEEVMHQRTILPIRFGTIAPNADVVLEQVLKRRYDELISTFEEVEDRVEMGVKAFWYEEVIFQEIVEENPTIRSLRDSLKHRKAEETYYDRIRLGEKIEAAMEKKRDEDSEKILKKFNPIAYKSRANKIITDKMVLNGAFLVNRSREPEFDEAMRLLDDEMHKRVMFKYFGPVPPYNFVNLVFHWDEE